MNFLRKLLFPFSILYDGVTYVRNIFFDFGILKSKKFELPVICVGNLSTGGTGKSPMIEFLIENLASTFQVGVVSRGYKRKTKGYWEVFSNQTAFEVGDEPLQIKRKFPKVIVAVSENRAIGIEKIKSRVDVVLLDDAYQHRSVIPSYTVLLTSFHHIYSQDLVLPAGNLRESSRGAKRADVVVVTKCPPSLSKEMKEKTIKKLALQPEQSYYFTSISYATQIKNGNRSQPLSYLENKPFLLVTGIANPRPLVEYLENRGKNFQHKAFSDHHEFSPAEVRDLDTYERILTTEKDFVRLQPFLRKTELWYLPISVSFLENEDKFMSEVGTSIRKTLKRKF